MSDTMNKRLSLLASFIEVLEEHNPGETIHTMSMLTSQRVRDYPLEVVTTQKVALKGIPHLSTRIRVTRTYQVWYDPQGKMAYESSKPTEVDKFV